MAAGCGASLFVEVAGGDEPSTHLNTAQAVCSERPCGSSEAIGYDSPEMPTGSSSRSRIFINYRREDTGYVVGRLADDLREHFAPGQVFEDVSSIEPGVDFVEALNRGLETCAAVLVVIGSQWLTIEDRQGRRRLDRLDDWVAIEIAESLKHQDVRVFPVLVNVDMPSAEDLPEPLRPLTRRQAFTLTRRHWAHDITDLVTSLKRVPGLAEAAPPEASVVTNITNDVRNTKPESHAGAEGDESRRAEPLSSSERDVEEFFDVALLERVRARGELRYGRLAPDRFAITDNAFLEIRRKAPGILDALEAAATKMIDKELNQSKIDHVIAAAGNYRLPENKVTPATLAPLESAFSKHSVRKTLQSASGTKCLVDGFYVQLIITKYPNADIYLSGSMKPIVVEVGGQVKCVLMPIAV